MRYIFLDIDDVLATDHTYKVWRKSGELRTFDAYVELIDPTCMALVDAFAAEASASIVVSSNWRHRNVCPHPVDDVLRAAGLRAPIVGHTPDFTREHPDGHGHGHRGYEINAYVVEHDLALRDFVIFDDDPLAGRSPRDTSRRHGARLVPTVGITGVTAKNVERARRLFGLATG